MLAPATASVNVRSKLGPCVSKPTAACVMPRPVPSKTRFKAAATRFDNAFVPATIEVIVVASVLTKPAKFVPFDAASARRAGAKPNVPVSVKEPRKPSVTAPVTEKLADAVLTETVSPAASYPSMHIVREPVRLSCVKEALCDIKPDIFTLQQSGTATSTSTASCSEGF